jgi:hypothetical protein
MAAKLPKIKMQFRDRKSFLKLRNKTIRIQLWVRSNNAKALRKKLKLEKLKREANSEHKDRVVHEIVTTEESYVRNLDVLVRVYMRPLRSLFLGRGGINENHGGKGPVTNASIVTIFGNVEDIYEKHALFYDKLVKVAGYPNSLSPAVDHPDADAFAENNRGFRDLASKFTLSSIFLDMTRWLQIYIPYCNTYNERKAELDRCLKVPSFADYLEVRTIFQHA